jgi:hypothetical protein
MKAKYRIYIVGDVPPDLKDRIAAVHAAGILKGKSEEKPPDTEVVKIQNRNSIPSVSKSKEYSGYYPIRHI